MLTERFIRSFDGTEIYVEELGDPAGVPLVLCDGLGCAGFVWRQLRPAFADRYRILHWHYRGHGLSRPPHNPGAMTVDDLIGDLLAVLDQMAIERAVLLGHSMGVQLVLEFAVRYGERILGLAPMCGSYGRPLWTFHDDSRAAEIFPLVKGLAERFPRVAQSLWKSLLTTELAYLFGVHVELNPSLVKRDDFKPYFDALAAIDVQLFVRLLDDLNRHTVEDRLHLIDAPTLVVGGEHDKFTPAWLSQRMADLIPGAELLMVPSGTHAAPIELPELVNLRLDRFLSEVVLPAAGLPVPVAKRQRAKRRRGTKTGTKTARSTRPKAAKKTTQRKTKKTAKKTAKKAAKKTADRAAANASPAKKPTARERTASKRSAGALAGGRARTSS